MLETQEIIILLIAGAFGGFISGLLGVGGGVIFIPLLDYFLRKLGMHNEELVKGIVANSLFAIIFTGSIISYKQYRMNNFYPNIVLATALPGIISSLFMSWLIQNGDWYSKQKFNFVFAALLIPLAFRMFFSKNEKKENHPAGDPALSKFSITGFFTGIVTSLSGLGGGVLMVPAFTDILKIDIKKATSVSTGVIPLFALPISIFYMLSKPEEIIMPGYQIGYIILPVIFPIIAGTFIFAPLGVKTASKLPVKLLRMFFGVFLVLLLTKILIEQFK